MTPLAVSRQSSQGSSQSGVGQGSSASSQQSSQGSRVLGRTSLGFQGSATASARAGPARNSRCNSPLVCRRESRGLERSPRAARKLAQIFLDIKSDVDTLRALAQEL